MSQSAAQGDSLHHHSLDVRNPRACAWHFSFHLSAERTDQIRLVLGKSLGGNEKILSYAMHEYSASDIQVTGFLPGGNCGAMPAPLVCRPCTFAGSSQAGPTIIANIPRPFSSFSCTNHNAFCFFDARFHSPHAIKLHLEVWKLGFRWVLTRLARNSEKWSMSHPSCSSSHFSSTISVSKSSLNSSASFCIATAPSRWPPSSSHKRPTSVDLITDADNASAAGL
jgi:hypothetical protein